MRRSALILVLVAVACAQPPKKELDLAAGRVARARHAGATMYSPELLTEAENALATARERLATRDYRGALRAAAFACVRADEARAIAVERRKRPTAEATRLVREAEALIAQALGLAKTRGVSEGFSKEIQTFESRLDAARETLAAGRPEAARELGTTLKSDLLSFHKKLGGI